MKSDNKLAIINNTQLWALVACSLWPTIIGYGGGEMAREAGRDMWLGSVLAVISALVLTLILIYVGRKFPSQTSVEYSRTLLGNIPSKFLGLLLMAYFLLGAHQSATIYVHHVADYLLPETPFGVITFIHIAVICYLVWQGPEVIARISVIGFIFAVSFILLLAVAVVQDINIDNIFPLLDHGMLPIANAGMTAASFIGPNILMITMLLPMMKSKDKAGRSVALGFIVGGIMFVFYHIAELMVMGPHTTAQMRIACMDLVRSIQITEYLHRFESFMAALWYWSILVQTGILTYCAILAFQQTFGLKKWQKAITIVFGFILISLIYLLGSDRIVFLNYLEGPWKLISVPLEYGLPVILLLLSFIRKPQKQ